MAFPTFVGIPIEVRLLVYQCLFEDATVKIRGCFTGDESNTKLIMPEKTYHDDLLLTCHQIYDEAQPVLASNLSITFLRLLGPADMSASARQRYLPSVTKLLVHHDKEFHFDLSPFTGLKQLTIIRSGLITLNDNELEGFYVGSRDESIMLDPAQLESSRKIQPWVRNAITDCTRWYVIRETRNVYVARTSPGCVSMLDRYLVSASFKTSSELIWLLGAHL